jgi:hypothetical protein
VDHTGAVTLLAAARDVTQAGRTVTGEIDADTLTDVPDTVVLAMAELTGRVPFTAALDADARLTNLTLQLKSGPWVLAVTSYDPVPALKPPATFVKYKPK